MRPLASSLIVLALSVFMSDAFAADVAAASKVDAVTVFPSGAEVTRLSKVRLQPGEHTILLNDLPANADANSIRVEGKSLGDLAIGSVDTRRVFVPRAEVEASAVDRKKLETDLEQLNDEKNLLNAAIEAAQAQKKLIAQLTDLPGRPVPAGMQAPAQPDWAALAQLIGERTAAAQKIILDTQVKIREVDRKVVEVRKQISQLAAAPEQRTQVRVAVTATGALEADLTVRYQIGGAGWTPVYDARLTTGSKTAAPKLQLVRRATIVQQTGEIWENVALSLSTTRPTQGSQAPDLQPMLVDVIDPTVRRELGQATGQMMSRTMAPAPPATPAPIADLAAAGGLAEAKPKVAQEIAATIEGNAFQAIYVIGGRNTVATNGEAKRVQIDTSELEPTLTARTVPKRDPKAFLYAKMSTPKTTAILAGQVALFRDGTYVGNGRFPQLAPGEDHELGFGQDDNIVVKYTVTDEKRSETGIISTSKNEAKSFKITTKSLHPRPMAVRVIDQFPVSLNQEIKVETNSKVPPTAKDPDDKRGLVYWDYTLAPDEERALEFGHRITWPAAKQITVR
jgi:uncharacterized protein (TIGR02231 family)